ncbi:MAG: GbsR/MarR family transcriptional regulator [Bacteroidales bacterium]
MANINERSAFIEESGLLFEAIGMTRMAGRILGYLMVTDKEMVSFDELTQVLQASKSSISTNVKSCIIVGFVKPVTTPGDRKTYYMLSPDISWVDLFEKRTQQLVLFSNLLRKGMQLRTNSKDKPSQWLTNALEFYEWILEHFPKVLAQWAEYKKQNNPN